MFVKLFELRDKKLKDNKKKGFTLVELIVVLVILAILAALLIPALTGYIDKAKQKSITAETRQVVMAAQTLVDEAYAKPETTTTTTITVTKDKTATNNISFADVAELAEVKADNITSVGVSAGKITSVVYTNGGLTCTYTAGAKGEKGTYECKKTAD